MLIIVKNTKGIFQTYRCGKVTNILVQIFMIQFLHNRNVDITLQIGQVHYHSGHRIARTSDSDQHFVVVTVTVWVIAFAVHFAVDVVAQQGTICLGTSFWNHYLCRNNHLAKYVIM